MTEFHSRRNWMRKCLFVRNQKQQQSNSLIFCHQETWLDEDARFDTDDGLLASSLTFQSFNYCNSILLISKILFLEPKTTEIESGAKVCLTLKPLFWNSNHEGWKLTGNSFSSFEIRITNIPFTLRPDRVRVTSSMSMKAQSYRKCFFDLRRTSI